MEMNKNNTSIPVCGGVKDAAEKRKSLTPAILGIPNSHGVRFSVNMTSEDKKELLAKLEEWRKARKQKLAASILAKQKQPDKLKTTIPSLPLKNKPISMGENAGSKFQDRQSVFERLYQNSGKIKKQEVVLNDNKQQQVSQTNSKKSIVPLNKPKKPEIITPVVKDETETLHKISKSGTDTDNKEKPLPLMEISTQNRDLNSVYDAGKIDGQMDGDGLVENTEEKTEKGIKLEKPVHLVTGEMKIPNVKSSKNGSEFMKRDENLSKHASGLKSLSMKGTDGTKGKNSLRRSISMMFHQRRKTESSLRRSISAKNLHEMNLNAPTADHRGFKTPQQYNFGVKKEADNETVTKSVMFVTPKNTKSLTSTCLRTKLENWLKMNGHSLEGYRHLRCFGVHDVAKPVAEATPVALNDSHYATAPNTPDADSNKENVTPRTAVQQADVKDVEKWLEELHRLIVELKYAPERCEEWLAAIRKKYSGCSKLPIYWECLAALHESKGDLKSAIEDYERAIIRGSEVDTVGESLAQLFDKMVIEQEKERKKGSKPKLEKGLDPKNIFKSTIIKFALQQKAIKQLSSEMEPEVRQQLYVATPVRRSTRLQTPYKSTDEITSLQSLTPEFRKNITFKPNESLLRRD